MGLHSCELEIEAPVAREVAGGSLTTSVRVLLLNDSDNYQRG